MDIFKSWLVEDYIAHRGLHNLESPENTLPAFQNAIDAGYPIEIDVQLLADNTVVVFHDANLSRLAGKDGYLKNLKITDLANIELCGTKHTIPTLEQTLQFINGKTPLLIEIKNDEKVGKLETEVWNLLKNYNGEFAIQSFNPYVLQWFKDNAPNVWRGQLSMRFGKQTLNFLKRFALSRMLLNKKVSEPHFISYEAKALPNRFVKKYKKLPLLAWTIRSQNEYLKTIKFCDNIIFENFEPKI
ncbi:MAG: glycerophosphodiester phosphodiesterase family protein [Clostridia bacterium]